MTTKLYNNNQTSIPSQIRKKFNVKADDIVEWIEKENSEVSVKFRKRNQINDIVGIVSTKKLNSILT